MTRYNNKKLQTQRNFQSIWHSKPEFLSTLLKEDQYIREYIIGTMKAKGWKLSEIIIKRKVKLIHIAFQIQNKKVKERKRWTKNRLKNRYGAKGSSIRRNTNLQGIHSSLSVRTKLRKINIKKRYLFFQLYLMITELRKMYPNNQITFYVQKTKPLQFNANLINSWIVENIKKKKSYRRLLNKVISKFKKAQNGLKPMIDNNNMVNSKMNKGSSFRLFQGQSLKKKDKKNFFSWITGNLIYLYKSSRLDLVPKGPNIHTQLNAQNKTGLKTRFWLGEPNSLENVHGLASNQLKRASYSKVLKIRLGPGRHSKRFRSLWLIWRRKYDSASKFSRSKKRSRRLSRGSVTILNQSKSSYLRKRLNKIKVIRPAALAKLGPINTILNKVALKTVVKSSLQPTWQLVGVTKKSKASVNKLALRGRLRKIKALKSIRTVSTNLKTTKSNRIESSKFKLDTITKLNRIESYESKLNGLSTVELVRILDKNNKVKSTGLSLKKSKSLMDSALISALGPQVNRRFSTIEINQDIRSTWKLMRKLSRGKNLKKRKIDRVKRHLSGVLKHRKEFNQDTLLLLNYYKLNSLSSSSQSTETNVMSLEAKNFLWQGKNFIRFLQLHPTLLDHTINCLTSHFHFNSQIEFLTRVWVGFFDYIYHYESRLCLGKWQGIRILLSGRVGYKKMGRAKKYSSFWGSLKNSSARLPLQYSYSQLHTRYGAVGVRVFVR